jgi:hypothetical protein
MRAWRLFTRSGETEVFTPDDHPTYDPNEFDPDAVVGESTYYPIEVKREPWIDAYLFEEAQTLGQLTAAQRATLERFTHAIC